MVSSVIYIERYSIGVILLFYRVFCCLGGIATGVHILNLLPYKHFNTSSWFLSWLCTSGGWGIIVYYKGILKFFLSRSLLCTYTANVLAYSQTRSTPGHIEAYGIT